MNRQEYMRQLENELRANQVHDVEDILAEYEQHFSFKLSEGYAEEEIANRLEKPVAIAEQFLAGTQGVSVPKRSSKVLIGTGLVFADILVAMLYVLLWGWIIVIGTFSLASTVLGICLIGNINIAGLIPPMPYYGGLVLGISCLGLGVLSSIGTIYSFLYVAHWAKMYIYWHKNTMNGGSHPSQSKHPIISSKFQRRLREVAIISMIVFGLALIIGLFIMFAYTDFKPFWHELGWFQ